MRGRIRGARAFEALVTETNAWLARRNVSVEAVEHVVTERRGFEEVVLHLDGQNGRVGVPHSLVADHGPDGRLEELRIYYSSWPLTGRHTNRPPLLQPGPELRESDVVAEYQRALAAGGVDTIVAAFEPDGYAREPAGGRYVDRGRDGTLNFGPAGWPAQARAFYERLFSKDGGIPLEHCALADDGRACALEYERRAVGHDGGAAGGRARSSTSEVRAGGSPRRASTTTPTHRSAHTCSRPDIPSGGRSLR